MFSDQSFKAFMAAITATLAAGIAITIPPGGISTTQILALVGTFIATFQATYWTTNADVMKNVYPIDDTGLLP